MTDHGEELKVALRKLPETQFPRLSSSNSISKLSPYHFYEDYFCNDSKGAKSVNIFPFLTNYKGNQNFTPYSVKPLVLLGVVIYKYIELEVYICPTWKSSSFSQKKEKKKRIY